jgi:hypothetical protein
MRAGELECDYADVGERLFRHYVILQLLFTGLDSSPLVSAAPVMLRVVSFPFLDMMWSLS